MNEKKQTDHSADVSKKVDPIDRQAAIDAFEDTTYTKNEIRRRITELPPAQPDFDYEEWCTDCKEYDKERNNCPRWNKVIKETLKDLQEERNKDAIQKFHDYQVKNLEVYEPITKEIISRFLDDTTLGYILELDAVQGGQENVNAWCMYDLTDFYPDCGARIVQEGEGNG